MPSILKVPASVRDIESGKSIVADDHTNGSAPVPAVSTLARPRPLVRRALHWVRRLHLYFGLFLFPWAVLYGFSGFLFNHPLFMSDQTLEPFGSDAWKGTMMETLPDPRETARQIIAQLQTRFPESAAKLTLVETEPVRYVNEFASATVKSKNEEVNLLIAVLGHGGTIRRVPAKKTSATAGDFPWAIGGRDQQPPRLHAETKAEGGRHPDVTDKLVLENSLPDRLYASIPALLEKRNLPTTGELTVTGVPDLMLTVETHAQRWTVRYNALRGTVTGRPFEATPQPLSWRRFMTRLHTAHGYPLSSTMTTRWFWAISVDAMAIVMIYWGGSGLLMWWQIKATRWWGIAVLLVSAATATVLALGMHTVFSAG